MKVRFRHLQMSGIACLALALLVRADDPWKSRPYKDWTDKEVARILGDSPWAKQVRIPAPWREGSSSVIPRRGERSAAAEGMPEAPQASAGADPAAATSSLEAIAVFFVRWASARTFRQAWLHGPLAQGKVKPSEAEQFLAQQPTEYEIVVVGPDMTPFQKLDEAALKAGAYLRSKSLRQKVPPSRVSIRRSEDGKRLISVAFHFPKMIESGEPVVAADEKGIEFTCHGERAIVSASFEPQKMMGREGMDL